MSQSPELQTKIAEWRAKSAAGTMTLEEMREAVRFLRGDRRSAIEASAAAKRTKARKAVKPAEELLQELKGL